MEEIKDNTNWKKFYWFLLIFLAVQIAIYSFIANLYN